MDITPWQSTCSWEDPFLWAVSMSISIALVTNSRRCICGEISTAPEQRCLSIFFLVSETLDIVHPLLCTQIPTCLEAETPDDCPEKRAGAFCSPNRSGMFRVAGKPIVLHVGADVQNAMSCMIQADAVLMGCSTFGQVAGLLTRGISLFSTDCGGPSTPHQYKTIPPFAVAERGHLWVPVAGSWRDPVLSSTTLLSGALDDLISIKGVQQ